MESWLVSTSNDLQSSKPESPAHFSVLIEFSGTCCTCGRFLVLTSCLHTGSTRSGSYFEGVKFSQNAGNALGISTRRVLVCELSVCKLAVDQRAASVFGSVLSIICRARHFGMDNASIPSAPTPVASGSGVATTCQYRSVSLFKSPKSDGSRKTDSIPPPPPRGGGV